jgi:magnesium-transporting ATPase (P-type)
MAQPTESQSIPREEPRTSSASRFQWLNWSSFFLAFLQSVCSAFLALHGIRFLVGIGALVLASSAWHLAERLHVSAIRIPMMLIALFGALLNLLALWQVRRLRRRSASAWRQQPLTASKRRNESLQLALSVLTLVLLLIEWIAHYNLKGTL